MRLMSTMSHLLLSPRHPIRPLPAPPAPVVRALRRDIVAVPDEHGSVSGDSIDGFPMEICEETEADELPALPTPVSGPVLPPSISTPSAEKIARLQRMEHLRCEIERLSSQSRRTVQSCLDRLW